ncbi:uncharacterized protein LOC114024006, partial [Vombatus ursinus]|uniref:uncharacterized protein LOC114024006 n=1 Tax=Vombatus ursinus TaxID=29139 RepID=UPI000FFDAB13
RVSRLRAFSLTESGLRDVSRPWGAEKVKELSGCQRKLSRLSLLGRHPRKRKRRRRTMQTCMKLLLLVSLSTPVAGNQILHWWAIYMDPPWPRVVAWGEQLPNLVFQGTASQMVRNEFDLPTQTNVTSSSVKYNFTGLSMRQPLCWSCTNNVEGCIQLQNVTLAMNIPGMGPHHIHLLGGQGTPCSNATSLRAGGLDKCKVNSDSGSGWPRVETCVAAHRHCMNFNGTVVQSWHDTYT